MCANNRAAPNNHEASMVIIITLWLVYKPGVYVVIIETHNMGYKHMYVFIKPVQV